jgi:hypothetical protein
MQEAARKGNERENKQMLEGEKLRRRRVRKRKVEE